MKTIDIYTFENADGVPIRDCETLDILTARVYAEEHHYRLIANVYVWSGSELVEDYTDTDEPDPETTP